MTSGSDPSWSAWMSRSTPGPAWRASENGWARGDEDRLAVVGLELRESGCSRLSRSTAWGGKKVDVGAPCANGSPCTCCCNLTDRHVRLIDEHQGVGAQVVDQRRRAALPPLR